MIISRSLAGVLVAGSLATLVACGSAKPQSGFDPNDPKAQAPAPAPGTDDTTDTDTDGGPSTPGFGGVIDGGGNAPKSACVNLQCQQVVCSGSAKTTVSGTVFDPAGKNPLYNVVVYVPNSTPKPIVTGASCDKCDTLYTGNPIATALSGPDGKFTIENVPAGDNIPLVIQIGKWRKQIKIPTVAQCVDNPITNESLTRLPANSREGDMPKIAITTGGSDSLECLLPRIGVDPTEITSTGTTQITIFQGTGGLATAAGSQKPEKALWNAQSTLMPFDIVALSCEGDEHPETKPAADLAALQAYENAGGRVFASHFHYYWLNHGAAPLPLSASWSPGTNGVGNIDGAIDQSFPKGMAFAQWLKNVNALSPAGTLPIVDAHQNAQIKPTNTGSQSWITNAAASTETTYFTFNTPQAVPEAMQCGRVVYSDLHVGAASNDYKTAKTVPEGCSTGDLSAQEKALEFMLFDLSSCLVPDSVPPTPPVPPPPPVR